MSTKSMLFIGTLTLDTHFHVPNFGGGKEGKYISEEAYEMTSGMAINAAISAKQLGGKVSVWSKIGDDQRGKIMLRELEKLGISTEYVQTTAGTSSSYATIIIGKDGDRWVIVKNTNISDDTASELFAPDIAQFSLVMADVRWPQASKLALSQARRLSKPAVLDADVTDKETLFTLSAESTHILASLDAAFIMTGEHTAVAATAKLHSLFGVFCCVTDGENGCHYKSDLTSPVRSIPAPKVDVIDTNGAGDVFHGAFCYGIASKMEEVVALKFAVVAASLKCQNVGTRLKDITRDDVISYLHGIFE